MHYISQLPIIDYIEIKGIIFRYTQTFISTTEWAKKTTHLSKSIKLHTSRSERVLTFQYLQHQKTIKWPLADRVTGSPIPSPTGRRCACIHTLLAGRVIGNTTSKCLKQQCLSVFQNWGDHTLTLSLAYTIFNRIHHYPIPYLSQPITIPATRYNHSCKGKITAYK